VKVKLELKVTNNSRDTLFINEFVAYNMCFTVFIYLFAEVSQTHKELQFLTHPVYCA